METRAIMIVGVGGQGTLLASRIIGAVLLEGGYDVKVSEVHGMSQRGGSVVTYVKYGDKVYSPVIEKGEADLILSFEELEAARWLPYLKKGGRLVLNTQRINPMPVIIGAAEYPEDITEKLKKTGADITAEAGSAKAVNVALLGVLSGSTDFGEDVWMKAIEKCVPEKALDINKKAFKIAREINNR